MKESEPLTSPTNVDPSGFFLRILVNFVVIHQFVVEVVGVRWKPKFDDF